MAYLTRDELIEIYGLVEIEKLEKNISGVSGGHPLTTEKAISRAEDFVISFVAKKYPLPLPATTEPIKNAISVLARYFLYKDRPTEKVSQDYEDTKSWLKQVSIGNAVLIFPDPEDQPAKLIGTGIFVV